MAKKSLIKIKRKDNPTKDLLDLSKGMDRFKRIMRNEFTDHFNSETIAEKGAKILMGYNHVKDKGAKKKLFADFCNLIQQYNVSSSLDNGYLLMKSMDEKISPMAFEMLDELKNQYKIETVQDKAYLQLCVSAFCRYQIDMIKYESVSARENLSRTELDHINILLKDVDRAFRQFESAIRYFDSRNKPSINLNIKMGDAFIAQNQQNISNKTDDDEKNERQ